MKKVLLLLFFSLILIGCGAKEPTIITKTEYLEFPIPPKYDNGDLEVKVYKENIQGKTYILMRNDIFIEIYKRYELYKKNYNNLYDSILEYNKLREN